MSVDRSLTETLLWLTWAATMSEVSVMSVSFMSLCGFSIAGGFLEFFTTVVLLGRRAIVCLIGANHHCARMFPETSTKFELQRNPAPYWHVIRVLKSILVTTSKSDRVDTGPAECPVIV